MRPNDADIMASSAGPDQMAPLGGLHCLLKPVYPKIWEHYGTLEHHD